MNIKGMLGLGIILLAGVAGVYTYMHMSYDNGIKLAVLNTDVLPVFKKSDPKVAYVGKDFTLPNKENNEPVYDKYTLKQRQEAGLPTTYGTTRDYFYGNHVAYLTFDDGPDKINTVKILDILKQENIHATFFLIGKNVEQDPDIVKRIYREGHAIGNHSYNHDYHALYSSPKAYTDELQKTDELIYNILGVRPVISRAPGGTTGHFSPAYWIAINSLGYIEVGWNSLTGDADGTGRTAAQEVDNIRKQLILRPYLSSHFVILMHSSAGHDATVQALPQIIKILKDNGYTFRVVTTAIPPAW